MNWLKEFQRKRDAIKDSNVIFVEYECGKAVVIPRDTPLNKVNEIAQAQYERAKQ